MALFLSPESTLTLNKQQLRRSWGLGREKSIDVRDFGFQSLFITTQPRGFGARKFPRQRPVTAKNGGGTTTEDIRKEDFIMRLYASKKEARTLQLTLAYLITNGNKQEKEAAQALLKRIADCLAMQVSQYKRGK